MRRVSRQLFDVQFPGWSAPQLTTISVSLCFLAAKENARVWGNSGRAARLPDRATVRMRKGVSLVAMAAVLSGNGRVNGLRQKVVELVSCLGRLEFGTAHLL